MECKFTELKGDYFITFLDTFDLVPISILGYNIVQLIHCLFKYHFI